jgi:hypothetical protein
VSAALGSTPGVRQLGGALAGGILGDYMYLWEQYYFATSTL